MITPERGEGGAHLVPPERLAARCGGCSGIPWRLPPVRRRSRPRPGQGRELRGRVAALRDRLVLHHPAVAEHRSRARRTRRCPCSWVMSTTVMPRSRLSRCRISMISTLVRLSRLPVGSSARISSGSLTSARAIATRCCWPPESWLGRVVERARRGRPRSSSARARLRGAPRPPSACRCRAAAARRSRAPSCAGAG